MDPNTAETPPGCLVILIPLSAAMNDDVRVRYAHRSLEDGEPDIREYPREFAARFLADELVEALVDTHNGGYPLALDLAVIGYHTDADGKTRFLPLLTGSELLTPPGPDGTPIVRLVPLADVANLAVELRSRPGDPGKWTIRPECLGTASGAVALAEAYRLVSLWLTGRFYSKPPVIVHCTAGEGLGDDYTRVARSLQLLVTAYGPPRLLHVGFTPGVEPALAGDWPHDVHDFWTGLQNLSAELPAEPEGRPARRAVSINDWTVTDAWSALFDMNLVEDTVAWTDPDAGRFAPTVREMWTQKMGNKPEEWEDAYATDPVAGVAVVSDGASTGIYCRSWADQLSKRFVQDRPDARDPAALNKWVHGLRMEWRANIDYPNLHWAKKRKVDEVGAAATLLGLEVGPANAEGNRPWRACAVGDASLFWVRDGQLLATFPVVAGDQFGSAPLLIRSNPGFKTVSLAAAGVCQPADRFLLATDAVAARLFKSVAAGPGPDWNKLAVTPEASWRAEMDALRRANDMVNDDCTLVVLRVAGGDLVAEEILPSTADSVDAVIPTVPAALSSVPVPVPDPAVPVEPVPEAAAAETPAPAAELTETPPPVAEVAPEVNEPEAELASRASEGTGSVVPEAPESSTTTPPETPRPMNESDWR